jgi:hypothetical protein
MYSAALSLRRTGRPDLVSTAVPFALAPRVTVTPTSAPAGDVDLTLTCDPPPRVGQRVLLILAGREPIASSAAIPPPVPGTPAVLPFHVPGLTAGAQVARLRVDGVDSLPYRVVTAPGAPPRLEFDPAQTVVIA